MKLILVRHGEARRDQQPDGVRALTALGRAQAASTAQQVLARWRPDVLISSPLLRAQQTLQAFVERLPGVPVQQLHSIKPDDDAAQALMDLNGVEGDCVLVVCHMDIVARMAALLLEDWPQGFALAEARAIELPVLAAGMGTELWRVLPHTGGQ